MPTMKSAFFSLIALVAMSNSAFACMQSEAQIIGTVTKASSLDNACAIQVRISRSNAHVFCPLELDIGQVIDLKIPSEGGACNGLVGSVLSGVVQDSGNGLRLDQ